MLKNLTAALKNPRPHNLVQKRNVFIIAEKTPNPESVMFYPQGKEVLGNL